MMMEKALAQEVAQDAYSRQRYRPDWGCGERAAEMLQIPLRSQF